MQRYFYVKDYAFDPTNTRIIRLAGYYTDPDHSLFFPTEGISREEAIKKIKSHEVLFLYDGCYRKLKIKLVTEKDKEYLRVDHHSYPMDYLG